MDKNTFKRNRTLGQSLGLDGQKAHRRGKWSVFKRSNYRLYFEVKSYEVLEMYQVIISEEYTNEKGNPDYEGSIGFPVPTKNIKDIKAAMFLMGVNIYRIESDNKPVYESARLLEITQRRVEKMAARTV